MMRARIHAGLTVLGRFLSPVRFTCNLLHHFPVPFALCVALWLLCAYAFN